MFSTSCKIKKVVDKIFKILIVYSKVHEVKTHSFVFKSKLFSAYKNVLFSNGDCKFKK